MPEVTLGGEFEPSIAHWPYLCRGRGTVSRGRCRGALGNARFDREAGAWTQDDEMLVEPQHRRSRNGQGRSDRRPIGPQPRRHRRDHHAADGWLVTPCVSVGSVNDGGRSPPLPRARPYSPARSPRRARAGPSHAPSPKAKLFIVGYPRNHAAERLLSDGHPVDDRRLEAVSRWRDRSRQRTAPFLVPPRRCRAFPLLELA
jgi:hypothetical protein